VTGNVGGNVTGSVGSVAAGGISAASIADGAIDAGAIADGAIDAATFAAGAITAASIAADAITDAKVAADVTIASVTGAVGSVTGAVGSVTGNVGGNVVGSVGSVAAGGITAASIATDAIDADSLAADAVAEIQSGLATAANLATVAGYIDTEVAAILAAVDTEVGDIRTRVLLALPEAAPNDPEGGLAVLAQVNYGGGDIVTILSGVDGAVWEKHEVLSAHNEGSTGKELYDQIAALATAAALTAVKAVTDKLDTLIQLNGAGPLYQFTEEGLELGPAGGGGGGAGADDVWEYLKATVAAQPTTTIGRFIYDQLAQIGTGQAVVFNPLNESGDLLTIVPGTSYPDGLGPFSFSGKADITGLPVRLAIAPRDGDEVATAEFTGTIITAGSEPQSVDFFPDDDDTDVLADYHKVKMLFDVIVTYGTGDESVLRGQCSVRKKLHSTA
jgi:hypothetical protein